jgi:hypothetical protein
MNAVDSLGEATKFLRTRNHMNVPAPLQYLPPL